MSLSKIKSHMIKTIIKRLKVIFYPLRNFNPYPDPCLIDKLFIIYELM